MKKDSMKQFWLGFLLVCMCMQPSEAEKAVEKAMQISAEGVTSFAEVGKHDADISEKQGRTTRGGDQCCCEGVDEQRAELNNPVGQCTWGKRASFDPLGSGCNSWGIFDRTAKKRHVSGVMSSVDGRFLNFGGRSGQPDKKWCLDLKSGGILSHNGDHSYVVNNDLINKALGEAPEITAAAKIAAGFAAAAEATAAKAAAIAAQDASAKLAADSAAAAAKRAAAAAKKAADKATEKKAAEVAAQAAKAANAEAEAKAAEAAKALAEKEKKQVKLIAEREANIENLKILFGADPKTGGSKFLKSCKTNQDPSLCSLACDKWTGRDLGVKKGCHSFLAPEKFNANARNYCKNTCSPQIADCGTPAEHKSKCITKQDDIKALQAALAYAAQPQA